MKASVLKLESQPCSGLSKGWRDPRVLVSEVRVEAVDFGIKLSIPRRLGPHMTFYHWMFWPGTRRGKV